MRKWKASLGIGSGTTISDASDPRKVIILSLGLEVAGREDIIIDLSKPGALADLSKHPFTIKEGATFRMKARFKVQHQILSGLKYVQVVSRMGVKQKMQEMIVSLHTDVIRRSMMLILTRARTRRIPPTSQSTRRNVCSPPGLPRRSMPKLT